MNYWLLWTLAAVLLVLAGTFYGRKGVFSAIAFAAVLLTKDAMQHFCGPFGEWTFVGLLMILCLVIYVRKKRNRAPDRLRDQ